MDASFRQYHGAGLRAARVKGGLAARNQGPPCWRMAMRLPGAWVRPAKAQQDPSSQTWAIPFALSHPRARGAFLRDAPSGSRPWAARPVLRPRYPPPHTAGLSLPIKT